jgi:hypothetical protein
MRLKEMTVCCGGKDTAAAYENAYYLDARSGNMILIRNREIGNDIYDLCTVSYSADHGNTWSEVRPWGYADGAPFHSPSSYSTIVRHSTGCSYWFGNICEENPDGNGPDYPVVAGEIDQDSLMLRRDTVCRIDTYRKEDPAPVHLRNFSVYEERSKGDLIMRMTRLWVDKARHMRGDAYLYRIET